MNINFQNKTIKNTIRTSRNHDQPKIKDTKLKSKNKKKENYLFILLGEGKTLILRHIGP